MLSLKQLLHKPVYDQNGIEIGKLNDVLLRRSDGKGIIVTDNGAYAADGITTRKGKIILDGIAQSEDGAQIGDKPLYSLNGKHLGTVYDVTFGKTLKIGKITCDTGEEYGRGRIYATDDIVIVKDQTPKQTKKTTVRKQTSLPSCEQAPKHKIDITKNVTYPVRRRYGDFSFLLGKISDKNITNFFGEVMIRAGDKVTHDTLRQAKISGKLIELCLHTK